MHTSLHLARSLVPTAQLVVRGIVILTLGLGMCLATLWAAGDLYQTSWTLQDLPIRASAIVAVWLVAWATLHLANRDRPLPPGHFLLATVLLSFAGRMLYLSLVDVPFVSDFASYWVSALDLAAQENYSVGESVYRQRAVPFLLPLAEISGGSVLALKMMNNLLLCLMQLLGYDLLRRARNHQIAQAFSILWIAAPEPFLSAAIPSHDLTSTALFALAFWLNSHAVLPPQVSSVRAHILFGMALGVAIAALEIARGAGTGQFYLICGAGLCATIALVNFSRHADWKVGASARNLSIQLVIACLISWALLWIASETDLRMPSAVAEAKSLRASTPQQTAMSDGTYQFVRRFDDNFNKDLIDDVDALRKQSRAIALSEFSERPIARLWSSAHRLPQLFQLGSSAFYLPRSGSFPAELLQFIQTYKGAFVVLFSILVLIGLVRFLQAPFGDWALFQQTLTLAGMVLAISLLRENQPRYIYPIWFTGSLIGAYYLMRPTEAAAQMLSRLGIYASQTVLLFGVVFGTLWWLVDHFYVPAQGRVLTEWELRLNNQSDSSGFLADMQERGTDAAAIDRKGKSIKGPGRLLYFGPLSIKLAIPPPLAVGRSVSATHRVCPSAGRNYDLTFQFYTPYKRLERRGAFELKVEVDGKTHWIEQIPYAPRPTRVTVADVSSGSECFDLSFSLRSNIASERASMERAAFVEVFYPRLVPTTPSRL